MRSTYGGKAKKRKVASSKPLTLKEIKKYLVER